MGITSEKSIYKKNINNYQSNINFISYIFCVLSVFGSLLLLIGLMLTGVFSKLKWSNILGLALYFAVTLIVSSIIYFLTVRKNRDNPTVTKIFKYVLVLGSYANYLGIVKNVPYAEAWGTIFFSVSLSALYLEFSTLAYSAFLCTGVSVISYFTQQTYVPQGNVLSELILRGLSISFGFSGAMLTIMYS
ncbi:MAG: hypothetical protein Q8920_14245, partial [Bacillota bacterium]|nr:hypothetical protein [Bacillota bacterium]